MYLTLVLISMILVGGGEGSSMVNEDDGNQLCSITLPPRHHRLSVCTMVHNEARYIEEWIAYHMLLKIDHFYVYDDQSTDNLTQVLAPYVKLGFVTIIPWDHNIQTVDPQLIYADPPYTRVQRFSIADCIINHQNESEWFGVWDIDEFIRLHNFFDGMPSFLEFAAAAADEYHIPLTTFGPADHEKTPEGLVLWNYQMRANLTVFGLDPYTNRFSGKSMYKSGCGTPEVHFSNELQPGCRKSYNWLSSAGPGELPISLHHYAIKSFEHYKEKMSKWNFYYSETSFAELKKNIAFSNWAWDGYLANTFARRVEELMDCMATL